MIGRAEVEWSDHPHALGRRTAQYHQSQNTERQIHDAENKAERFRSRKRSGETQNIKQ